MSVGTVIVAHQVGRRCCTGEGLGDLSGQPLGCRMSRYLKPQQLAPAVAQNQKREQSLKGQGRNHTQINGGDRLRMVAKKCLPALRRRRPTRYHVFGDSRLRGAFLPAPILLEIASDRRRFRVQALASVIRAAGAIARPAPLGDYTLAAQRAGVEHDLAGLLKDRV
jgi:hypothetical protein